VKTFGPERQDETLAKLIQFGLKQRYLMSRPDGQVMMRKSAPKKFLRAIGMFGVRFIGETRT
jgi:hypothetical protein